ncbi:hypothetical protein Tco_1561392 [Tanacetum coccineum]
MLRAFYVSLTGAASRWLRNQPSGSITTWEVLKTKFLNKYCPHARTTKKMEEVNNFQQELDEREVILFYKGLDVPARQILDSKGVIPSKTAADAKIAIQKMAEYSHKWHNGTSSRTRSTETSDELAAIQAQLNNLRREIKHEENSNIIKEIRVSTDVAIRNQGASIKTMEIQIRQMRKVLQERGFGSLPTSTEMNPRDQVKSISTAKAGFSQIRRIGHEPYAVSGTHHKSLFFETVPFPRRLQNFSCDDWREAQDVKILDTYDHSLPQKEKDPGSFTLPCFIHNICFIKALVDLGASVSVMPFSTYTNLGLGILSHTRLTIELADRTIKQPKGIAENVLIKIGKFIFPIDFIILDIPEDNDVPFNPWTTILVNCPFQDRCVQKEEYFKGRGRKTCF